ncbi:MAG: hypothetical protein M3N19_10475 [Candidatus Eremiobacteraeota bacterium]|nr:hypothetical protein [Candidatus Eremiobacteraeota bacterium]
MIYLIALGLGFVSGLRTFTSIAALLLVRGGTWGIVACIAALGEYVIDLMPWVPSRTAMPSIIVRSLSGAFVGYLFATMHGASGLIGGVGGVIGAIAGTFGGHSVRLWAIDRIGAIPAGLAEDLIAIGIAISLVLAPIPGG